MKEGMNQGMKQGDDITPSMDAVKQNIISMFGKRHSNKVASILNFLLSIPDIKLSATGHIIVNTVDTFIHASDLITDMIYPFQKQGIPAEYKNIYNILYKHRIPNKLLSKARRIRNVQSNWEKF